MGPATFSNNREGGKSDTDLCWIHFHCAEFGACRIEHEGLSEAGGHVNGRIREYIPGEICAKTAKFFLYRLRRAQELGERFFCQRLRASKTSRKHPDTDRKDACLQKPAESSCILPAIPTIPLAQHRTLVQMASVRTTRTALESGIDHNLQTVRRLHMAFESVSYCR